MKHQIAKIIYNGTWTVVHDDTVRGNAYTIYHSYYECSNNAPAKKHKKKIIAYADFNSCLYDFIQRFNPHIGILPYEKGDRNG